VATRGIIRGGVAIAAVTMAGVAAVGVLEALLREEGITLVFARLEGPMRQAPATPACSTWSASITTIPPSEPPSRPPLPENA
jgi:hypothetical protein